MSVAPNRLLERGQIREAQIVGAKADPTPYNLPMPAYYLVDIREVKDAAKMEDYRSRIRPVVEKFGGVYVVRGGPFEVLEGSYQPVFPVMIQFPSLNHARDWYNSEEYRELKQLRLASTVSNAVFLAGV